MISLAKKKRNANTDVDAVTHQILNMHGSFRPAHIACWFLALGL